MSLRGPWAKARGPWQSVLPLGKRILTPATQAQNDNAFGEITKATSKNKLTYSAFVGSINDAFPTFRKGIESVVAFGNRMVQGVSAVCHKLHEIGNTEINIDFAGAGRSMRSSWDAMMNRHSASHLSNRYSESELGEMLRAELSMDVVG